MGKICKKSRMNFTMPINIKEDEAEISSSKNESIEKKKR